MKFIDISDDGGNGDANEDAVVPVLTCEESVVSQKMNNFQEDGNSEEDDEAFNFNPNASEFVPVKLNLSEDPSFFMNGHTIPGEGDHEYPHQNFNSAVPNGICQSVETSYVPEVGSYIPDTEQFMGRNSEFRSFHYFPEPPQQSFSEPVDESINHQPVNFYEDESEPPVKEFVASHDRDTLQTHSVTPVVPVSCVPLYGLIGYSYTMPETTPSTSNNQIHTLFKVHKDSKISSGATLPVSHQPTTGFVPVMRPQFPTQMSQPIQQLQSPQPQTIPFMQQFPIPLPPRNAVPNAPLQARPSTQTPPRPGTCVTVYVPNISEGDGSYQNQKSYPSLIPAIMPQNTFRWVHPNQLN